MTRVCVFSPSFSMALTLHQSGHGHSHGGVSSHGHGHSHDKKKGHAHNGNHSHNNREHVDVERNADNHSTLLLLEFLLCLFIFPFWICIIITELEIFWKILFHSLNSNCNQKVIIMIHFSREKVPAGQCQCASSLRPRGGRSAAERQRPRQCPHHLFQGQSQRRSPVKGEKPSLCQWRLYLFAFFSRRTARIQDGRPYLHLPLLLICPVHHIHHLEGHCDRPDGR